MGIVMGAMKNLAIVAAEEGFQEMPEMEYAVVVDGAVTDTYTDPNAAREDARRCAQSVTYDVHAVEVVPFIQFKPEVFLGEDDDATGII